MTSSGTYAFSPSTSDFVLNAYALCGVKRTELLQQHMVDARFQANMMQMEMNNRGVDLWTVDLQTETLVEGTATYNVTATTIGILDAYIRTTDSNDTPTDRLIFPISRSDYAAIPDKDTEAPPTSYWFDRLIAPTITLWQVPDGAGPYELRYYRWRQIQDATPPDGATPEIPQRFFDYFTFGLAARLAIIYAPERAAPLDTRAERAWQIASTQDTERVPLYISPGLAGYFR